jgi:hypothetical protein
MTFAQTHERHPGRGSAEMGMLALLGLYASFLGLVGVVLLRTLQNTFFNDERGTFVLDWSHRFDNNHSAKIRIRPSSSSFAIKSFYN